MKLFLLHSDLQPFSLSPPRRPTRGYCAVSQAFSVLLLTIVSTIYAKLDRTCCHVPSSSNHLIFRTRATAPHSASAPATDSCCTTCLRDLSRSALSSQLQTGNYFQSLPGSRMCATLESDDDSGLARLQIFAWQIVVGRSC